ncbi:type III-B CRISPR module RAMP protein Cmr6 [Parabacteroides sp.]|uniref:type III-B CRISPR module RAMP protein Cmr6 n=1 Tax=Parabacteroides sp. TaxID=1869337 RepID=UPI00257C76DA|nr:type III-B CRISPR module RAMP protein Cmr6 [Parabacteroides sp.]
MNLDISWIEAAQQALLDSGIVKEGSYPKAYKGYISSLAASIVQSGLIPALSIYEADNEEGGSSAENNRAFLIYAIVLMLFSKNKLHSNDHLLSDYVIGRKDTSSLLRDINQALIALKLAIRIYKPSSAKLGEKVKVNRLETQAKIEHVSLSSYDYSSKEQHTANLGWLYYKDLYRSFKCYQYKNENGEDITSKHQQKLFEQKVGTIFNARLNQFLSHNQRVLRELRSLDNIGQFVLKTTYPGLLTGIGLSHGVKNEADIKVGFQFDYTTGLPYIPGSSVKGVLRSVFPDPKRPKDDFYNKQRISYIQSLLRELVPNQRLDEKVDEILNLSKLLFDEVDTSFPRDIFMDALLGGSETSDGKFLGNDYITPHNDNPFADPVPIQFMKVLPGICFTFTFKLDAPCSLLDKDKRVELYKKILLHVGIGAKTNVGYGHLVVSE